jgi:hypothetical protein
MSIGPGIGIPGPPIGSGETIVPTELRGTPPVTPGPESPPIGAPPPERPQAPGTLPDLSLFGALLVVLGLLALVSALRDFLNWWSRFSLGRLWRQGGGDVPTNSALLQPLSNYLGNLAVGFDQDVAMSFEKLSATTSKMGQALLAIATLARALSYRIAGLEGNAHQTAQQAADAAQAARGALNAAQTAQGTASAVGARTAAQTAALGGALKAQTTHITQLIEPELDTLRSRIGELEHGATTAWDLLKQHDEALSIAGVTAATAAGLARLGASWVECDATQLLGRSICGAGANTIEHLLEGLLDIAALYELCALVGGLVDAAESGPVQDVIATLADGAEELIQCRGLTLAAGLPSSAYAALAPAGAYAELAPVV